MASARSMDRRTRAAMSSSCCVVRVGLASATSMAVRMTVSGVRSSCEAFATNRRCAANARSRRSSMSSKVSASSLSSSWAPVRASRSPRCWSEARRAVSVMARTGRSTRPETNQPRPPEATVITPRPSREYSSRLCRARWRTMAAASLAPALKALLAGRDRARVGVRLLAGDCRSLASGCGRTRAGPGGGCGARAGWPRPGRRSGRAGPSREIRNSTAYSSASLVLTFRGHAVPRMAALMASLMAGGTRCRSRSRSGRARRACA